MSYRTLLALSLFVAFLASMGLVSPVATTAQAAATLQDFTADFPPPPQPPPRLFVQGGSDPGPTMEPAWDGRALFLTHAVNSQGNGVYWNQVVSGPYDKLEINFEFLIDNGPDGADGFGVAYLDSGVYGATTNDATPGFTEEVNLTGSLGVGFDTFHNDGLDPIPGLNASLPNSMSLHWDGAKVGDVDISGLSIPMLENSVQMDASIVVEPTGGGSNVTVSVTDGVDTITPFNNFFVSGLTPYDGRLAVRGRTGGANQNQELDNIFITHTPTGGVPNAVLLDDFETDNPPPPPPPTLVGGTPFTAAQRGGAPGPTLLPESKAVAEGFIRIAHEAGSQSNSIAFDKTSDETSRVIAEFDYRGKDDGQMGRADGGSFLLIPTDAYGETGEVPDFGAAEEPNLAGALGVGFDTFEGDGEPTVGIPGATGNHISLHFDGAELGRVAYPLEELDLVNGVFNHVTVELVEVPGGSEVTVEFIDGTDGSVHVPFEDVFIAGAKASSPLRGAFAFRTGGAADNYDIDNVNIQFIPEPSTLGLLAGLGVAGVIALMWRRRRQ